MKKKNQKIKNLYFRNKKIALKSYLKKKKSYNNTRDSYIWKLKNFLNLNEKKVNISPFSRGNPLYFKNKNSLLKADLITKSFHFQKMKEELDIYRNHAILNFTLGCTVSLLIYLKFYKLAFTGFIYLLIKNSSFVKNMFFNFVIEDVKYNGYYKDKFPFFFYSLPIVGIGSLLGMYKTSKLLDIIFQEMVLTINPPWHRAVELYELELQLYGFAFFCLSSLLINVVISFHVIKNTSDYTKEGSILFLIKLIVTIFFLIGICLFISEAFVAPTKFSQFIHITSGLGRGWDCEINNMACKMSALKCLQLLGREKFLVMVNIYSKDMIITTKTLQNILETSEVKQIINEFGTPMDLRILNFPFSWGEVSFLN